MIDKVVYHGVATTIIGALLLTAFSFAYPRVDVTLDLVSLIAFVAVLIEGGVAYGIRAYMSRRQG